jgi:integrase/recombinase XerD
LPLNDVLKEFLFECEIKKYSKRTIKSYKNNNALFFTFISNEFQITELEDITAMHIKRYFQYLNQKGLKPTYVNSILKNLRAFFVFCVDEEYIDKSPTEKVKWQREGKVIINTFNDKEILAMLDVYKFTTFLPARNKMILLFLLDTGARNNEVCTLLKEDVKERVILLRGKGNKERQVSISPLMRKYMIRYERIRDYYFKDKVIKVAIILFLIQDYLLQ